MSDQLTGRALTPDMRIGIIGAGASGLTAADCPAKQGCHSAAILEKTSQVGGKCASVTVDGRAANFYDWRDMPRLLWQIGVKYGWRPLGKRIA